MAQPQDEVVWQIINHGHCSFRAKADRQNFCRNEHNVTGLCNRSSCPLANSRYATIREDNGRLYLCIKTIERSHTPKKLWQKIRLSRNYLKALGQVDEHLAYWPKFLVHKNKQRLTKITQYLIRMRKLALKPRVALVTEPTRLKKQDKRKEAKALKAAQLETSIENELLARLNSGTYGDIYNFPMTQYNSVLDKQTVPDGEDEVEKNARADTDVAEDETDEEIEYVEDLEESDEDMEDLATNWGYGGESGSEDESEEQDSDDEADGSSSSDDGGSGSEDGEGGAGERRRSRPGKPAQKPGKTQGRRAAAGKKRGRGAEMEMEEEHELSRVRR